MRYIIAVVVLFSGNFLFSYELGVWIKAGGIPDVISTMLLPLGFNMSAWIAILIVVEGHLHRHGGSS